jgi:hypothetical protein
VHPAANKGNRTPSSSGRSNGASAGSASGGGKGSGKGGGKGGGGKGGGKPASAVRRPVGTPGSGVSPNGAPTAGAFAGTPTSHSAYPALAPLLPPLQQPRRSVASDLDPIPDWIGDVGAIKAAAARAQRQRQQSSHIGVLGYLVSQASEVIVRQRRMHGLASLTTDAARFDMLPAVSRTPLRRSPPHLCSIHCAKMMRTTMKTRKRKLRSWLALGAQRKHSTRALSRCPPPR